MCPRLQKKKVAKSSHQELGPCSLHYTSLNKCLNSFPDTSAPSLQHLPREHWFSDRKPIVSPSALALLGFSGYQQPWEISFKVCLAVPEPASRCFLGLNYHEVTVILNVWLYCLPLFPYTVWIYMCGCVLQPLGYEGIYTWEWFGNLLLGVFVEKARCRHARFCQVLRSAYACSFLRVDTWGMLWIWYI
jgi:hypothetical protein